MFINMAPLLGMGNLRTFVTIIVLVQFCNVSMALRANPRDGAFVGYSEKVSDAVETDQHLQTEPDMVMNSSCVDEKDECIEWAIRDECVNNKVYMESYCRQSCRFCQPYIQKSPFYGKNLRLVTPRGEVDITLFWDAAPETCHLMAELAEHPQANPECSFYRNEAVPEAGSSGPPYGLLQGVCQRLAGNPPKEQTKQIKKGHVAIIHPGKDFYVALMDHEDWSMGHTAWGEINDLSIVNRILQEPFTDHQHMQYGTHMRMMNNPMHFTLQLKD